MTRRVLPWLLPVALLACGDDSSPPGAGESSTGGSASTGSETSTGATQASLSESQSQSESDPTSGSTDDPSSGPSTGEPSTGEPPTSGGTESSSGSTGSGTGEPETSSSSGALVCDIVEVVEDAAIGKMEPVDCGFVTLADMVDEWEAAHDCVVENYGNQAAFTVVAELQGIDSEVYIGYAGMVGESYVASQFFSDSFGGITIYGTTPCDIAVVAGCDVAVGDLCLECVDPPPSEVVCEA